MEPSEPGFIPSFCLNKSWQPPSLIQRVITICGQLDQKNYRYNKCPLKLRISIHKKS